MIALDTNILVYARRAETTHHKKALSLLRSLAEGSTPWAIPWPCIYEYLRVITHSRVFAPPTDLDGALEDLESLFNSPSLILIGEGTQHRKALKKIFSSAQPTGNLVHDAHIAALALEHGVYEILSTDRDFTRFSPIKVRNPFL